jgi:alpha-amylase
MAITNTGFNTPTELIDVVSCATYTTDNKGAFTASVKNGLPAVFIPSSQKGNLCGTVTAAANPSGSGTSAGFREVAQSASLAAFLLPVVALYLF